MKNDLQILSNIRKKNNLYGWYKKGKQNEIWGGGSQYYSVNSDISHMELVTFSNNRESCLEKQDKKERVLKKSRDPCGLLLVEGCRSIFPIFFIATKNVLQFYGTNLVASAILNVDKKNNLKEGRGAWGQ